MFGPKAGLALEVCRSSTVTALKPIDGVLCEVRRIHVGPRVIAARDRPPTAATQSVSVFVMRWKQIVRPKCYFV